MTASNVSPSLPTYHRVMDVLSPLDLPISTSELHGLICGYLCAGDSQSGEHYIRTLLSGYDKAQSREALLCLFELFAFSQQQMEAGDFAFCMLLPEEHETLSMRAQAFSEWCEGFTQGITLSGIGYNELEDEEAKDALNHISEFAQLDYEELSIEEDDEKALVEVSEYTRMAVLRLYHELQMDGFKGQESKH